jgi:hypothetical protein
MKPHSYRPVRESYKTMAPVNSRCGNGKNWNYTNFCNNQACSIDQQCTDPQYPTCYNASSCVYPNTADSIIAIVDVVVPTGNQSDNFGVLNPDYTGLVFNTATSAWMNGWNFINDDKTKKPMRNATASNVNTGSNHVTVWVKYDIVSKSSSTPILTDIKVNQWEECHYYSGCNWIQPVCGDGFKPLSRLTEGSNLGCDRNGMCVKFAPANTVSNFVSSLGWSYDGSRNTQKTLRTVNAVDAYLEKQGGYMVNVFYDNIVLFPTKIPTSDPTYFANPRNGVQSGCPNLTYIYLCVGKATIKR